MSMRRRSSAGWTRRPICSWPGLPTRVLPSGSSVARLLTRHGITRKKRLWSLPRFARTSHRPVPNGGTERSGPVEARTKAGSTDPALRARGARCSLHRHRPAWSLAQQHIHRRAALRPFDAPMLIEGAIRGCVLCLGRTLAPSLSAGDSDLRSASTRRRRARHRPAARSCAFSPTPRMIEMVFAKLKALVRSAAARCGSRHSLGHASALTA